MIRMAERRDTRLRFEQWAHNPECGANTISAVLGVRMSEVAEREGIKPTMGQSPFALARGRVFEKRLFDKDAARLREAMEVAGVLPAGTDGFGDERLRQNGGSKLATIEQAIDATSQLLRRIAVRPLPPKGDAAHPTIVAGATLRIPANVMLPEAILIVDVLAIRYDADAPLIHVGEIKTYPDRGGYTDTADLAGARAQAGIYLHGLRLTIAKLGLDGRITCDEKGFLVLTKPGSNRPSVRAGEDLKYQAWRAERGFAQLETTANDLGKSKPTDPVAEVQGADTEYTSACLSFCDRAPKCFAAAVREQRAVILGEDVERFLSGTSLPRAVELLDGASPENDAERDLARRLNGEERA